MFRKLAALTAALTVGSALAGCGAASTSGSGSDSTIKIAMIPPTSGALAQFGTDAVKGWQVAVDQVNADGGINGQKVELLKKSTDGDPATTIRVAKEVTSKDGATYIGSVMTSPEHAALNAQLGSMGALEFNALGKDDALVGEQCAANAFHIVQTDSMDINGLASSISSLPGKKWAIQAVDYATGHTAADVFTKAVKAAGKQVVRTQFAPLNTTDFGSYITKLKNSGADSVFAVEYGADGVAFVKQATQFKLGDQVKTTLGFNMVSEPLFKALGDSIIGYYNNVGYDKDGDNALNKAFAAAYRKKYGTAPYYVPADQYLAAETLFAGMRKAKSSAPKQVAAALNGLSFDSIVGKVTMRGADHQLLRPSYLGRVEKGAAGTKFKILHTAQASETTPQPNPACKM